MSAATSLTAPARTSRFPAAGHSPVRWLGVRETAVTTSAWLSLGGDPRRLPGTWPRGSYRALVVRVGFIGVGRMGLPMCQNLVRAGYQVTAGDARAELESMVTGSGARWEGRPAVLAAEADVLITMLPGPGAVHDVLSLIHI